MKLVYLLVIPFFLVGCGSDSSDESPIDESPNNDLTPPITDLGTEVTDPAPLFNDPGSFGCEGCPSSSINTFNVETSESSFNFVGQVLDSDGAGEFYVVGDDGSMIGGSIPPQGNGNYDIDIPLFCGTQTVKFVWSNDAGKYILVTEVVRNNCISPDIQATLTWDETGRDFELHLVRPGGQINVAGQDCTWNTCVNSSPDWGVIGESLDNPVKDVDDTGPFGPENIFLANPEPGVFSVFVEHWGSGSEQATGSVTLNVAGETVRTTISELAPRHVWNVGRISWPSGDVELDGRTLDCSNDWTSGCTLNLPAEWPIN